MRRTMLLIVAWGLSATVLAQEPVRSLSLSDAISLALQNNPDAATAQQRLAAARAALRQTEAAFYPHVRVSESYTGTDNPVQAFMMNLTQRDLSFGPTTDFNDPPTTDNLNTKLIATYSLYDGGRNFAARQAARLGSEAASETLAAVRNDLVFEVTRSFHTIEKARQLVRTAEAGVASMESNVGVAKDRFARGSVLKTDLLDAEVRLAEARESSVRARNALAVSETIFRNVLGLGEGEMVTAADAAPTADVLAGESDVSVLDISGHPALRAAEKAVSRAEREVRVARGGYLPRVNAFASYDLDSGDLSRFADSVVAGVRVELDVFDGFLTRGKVDEARANLVAAREQLRKRELTIHLEARQAQLNVEEARARLETTARAVEQAEESREITKERYAHGLALLTQLLDAETALTAARQRRLTAEADLQIAAAALKKALGQAWEERR